MKSMNQADLQYTMELHDMREKNWLEVVAYYLHEIYFNWKLLQNALKSFSVGADPTLGELSTLGSRRLYSRYLRASTNTFPSLPASNDCLYSPYKW